MNEKCETGGVNMILKVRGIYRHKNEDAYSIILREFDNGIIDVYCIFTHSNTNKKICEECVKRYRIYAFRPDYAFIRLQKDELTNLFDGYIGDMPDEIFNEITEDVGAIYFAPYDEAIVWLLDEQTCSNCQYCKKTTEGMIECTRDYHLISSSFQASNDTCKDFVAFYEKEM